jgi:hypothetical protein
VERSVLADDSACQATKQIAQAAAGPLVARRGLCIILHFPGLSSFGRRSLQYERLAVGELLRSRHERAVIRPGCDLTIHKVEEGAADLDQRPGLDVAGELPVREPHKLNTP